MQDAIAQALERPAILTMPPAMSAEDLAQLVRMIEELRELTQSRRTYAAAAAFLHRLGYPLDSGLVLPDADSG